MSLIPEKRHCLRCGRRRSSSRFPAVAAGRQDYRVRCFDSAETFLSRYDPREVACLIVDIRMGGATGLELQDRLIERKSPLPIVFITGHGDVPMAVNTMKKGADFIQKAPTKKNWWGLVERMLDHARESFRQLPAGRQPRRPALQAHQPRPRCSNASSPAA